MRTDRVPDRLELREQFTMHRDVIYTTNVVQVAPGYEERYPRTAGRSRWTFTGYGIDGGEMRYIRDFFIRRKGRQQGFIWNSPATSLNDVEVRFARDTLRIRYIAYDAWDFEIELISLQAPPAGSVGTPDNPSAADTLGTPDITTPEFPAELIYGAETTIEFETIIQTASDGTEWRQARRWFPRWRVHVAKSPVEYALADSARQLYLQAGGRWKSFYATVPGVMDKRVMRFDDDLGAFEAPGPQSAGVDLELVSVPQQN